MNSSNGEREQARWFVMRAYKSESLAEERLTQSNLHFFIPKHYVIRTYHGVKSRRLVPAIPGLLFVHAPQREIAEFKKINNFLQFVMWNKSTGPEYVTIPNGQMENFIKIASQYEENITYYSPDEIDLKRGTRVLIHGGNFDGVTGTFIKVQGKRNRRVVAMLEGITAIAAEVQPHLIEVLS